MCDIFFLLVYALLRQLRPLVDKLFNKKVEGCFFDLFITFLKLFYLLYIINAIIYKLANNQVLVLKSKSMLFNSI